MASERFKIAIVGAGPAGLSAAARAAESRTSHVLLEASPQLANTIHRYQKGKHIMAEPGVLPLRAAVTFEAGTRERILQAWQDGIAKAGTNVRFRAAVAAITGSKGNFAVKLGDGSEVVAESVVLAIGLQGNLRKMEVPGDDLPGVQYQLDDPNEYHGETIVVVGAGDAAIENALALSPYNTVIILNRRDEFSRAKEGNLKGIMRAIESGQLACIYNASPRTVERLPDEHAGAQRLRLLITTQEGETEVPCNRVIARLGALPPRKFVESCGVTFPNDDPAAVPAVSPRYESNVPGLYIIGALAGYPLIKQCINQGYEVVEFICGRDVEPADEGLLRAKFARVPGLAQVERAIAAIREGIPLFSGLTPLQLREFLLDSEIRTPAAGEIVVQHNDYTNTFFSVLRGTVHIRLNPGDPSPTVPLGAGKFFGEMSLISGRRRTATIVAGDNCVLIETPRRSMNRLIQSVEAVKREIDEAFVLRAIRMHIAPEVPEDDLLEVVHTARLRRYAPGDTLFKAGDVGDSLHLIRTGSVTIANEVGGHEVVIAYLPSGNYVGELALLTDSLRTATVRAAVATETIQLPAVIFRELLACYPELEAKLKGKAQQRLRDIARSRAGQSEAGNMIEFLVAQGIGEATDVLLIDEALCVGCDNCEKACADTHGGTSLLDRAAGPSYATVHVPTSCRHCEHPHCMKDCPPDAIHRTAEGEVYIADNCIGCGNCQQSCPYGVIQMAVKGEAPKPGLWQWLLFGKGPAPGTEFHSEDESLPKRAVKCDMCKDQSGGPACVRACPTGAAIRVSPQEFMAIAR
jgi:thioredoxin reductase/Fe-S-cluster-containing hydrogenase component 2/CRP-like cAMP-binding protein